MNSDQSDLFSLLTSFTGKNLTKTLAQLEQKAQGLDLSDCVSFLEAHNASDVKNPPAERVVLN